MKSTTVRVSRAVRMYVPMQAAPAAAWSENRAASTASQEGPASKDARTARRLTDAILRTRASRNPTSQLQQQAQAGAPMRTPLPVSPPSNTASSLATRTTSRLVNAEEASEALQLALSYGKSALLTHLAHQQDDSATLRPYAYSEVDWACVMGEEATAGAAPASRVHKSAVRPSTAEDGALALAWEMEQTWAALDGTARVRWITSTPQGRRALRHAMATPAPASDAEEANSVPSMCAMLSKYADVLVRPRQPRAAALPSAPRRHVLLNIFAEETQDSKRESSAPPPMSSQLQLKDMLMHGAAPDNANRASLRLKADAARAVEREKVWLQNLAACLGGDNAVKFVNDVKSLQRPREDSGEYDTRSTASTGGDGAGGAASLTGPAMVSKKRAAAARESDSLYSSGLLDLCEELGIRSPRRAYVLSRVLRQVDSASTTAQPIALSQVRELTASYAAEYDKEVKRIAADALASGRVSPEKAVGDFEKYQLDLAVDSVNVRLQKFQSDLPLLRNCTSVFNK